MFKTLERNDHLKNPVLRAQKSLGKKFMILENNACKKLRFWWFKNAFKKSRPKSSEMRLKNQLY